MEGRAPLAAVLEHEALHVHVAQIQLGYMSRQVAGIVRGVHDHSLLLVADIGLTHRRGEVHRRLGGRGQPHVQVGTIGVLEQPVGGRVGQFKQVDIPTLAAGRLWVKVQTLLNSQ